MAVIVWFRPVVLVVFFVFLLFIFFFTFCILGFCAFLSVVLLFYSKSLASSMGLYFLVTVR